MIEVSTQAQDFVDQSIEIAGTQGLTAEDILGGVLKRLIGPNWEMSAGTFQHLAWVLPTVTLQYVIMRKYENRVQVFLTRRPLDDKTVNWRGKLHVPGTVFRVPDKEGIPFGSGTTMKRVAEKELDVDLSMALSLQPIGPIVLKDTRGKEISFICFVSFGDQKPKEGDWYDAEPPPTDLIEGQKDFLKMAADTWRRLFFH